MLDAYSGNGVMGRAINAKPNLPRQGMPLLTTPILPPGSLGGHPQPSITGFELVLRPWQAADRPAIMAAYSDPEIQRYHTRSMNAAEAIDWLAAWARAWEQETAAGWAVTDGSEVLGRVALRWMDLHDGVAEVGYWVLPGSRGQRVASRALSALTGWAFNTGFHRLELLHSVQNPASCSVAKNVWYELEGTKRQDALHADGWHDMHLHARLADDAPSTLRSRHGN